VLGIQPDPGIYEQSFDPKDLYKKFRRFHSHCNFVRQNNTGQHHNTAIIRTLNLRYSRDMEAL
jgi:hypothetical protein